MKKALFSILFIVIIFSCSQKNNTPTKEDNLTANDLINETSPYLLQHAYNPVDWKAWSNTSLKLAEEQNKLIIISVGYSTCHWCHVMEEESFENDSVAKIMNANFINIKVDREERPDVDQVYMNAVQLMTGSGGWPLNCITLPDGRPVFGGTYFTKEQWTKILVDMSTLYKLNPEKVIAYAERLTEGIRKSDLITVNTDNVEFNTSDLAAYIKSWKTILDFKDGGQKKAPKFPMPSNLSFLLRHSFQNNDTQLQNFVITTLTKMADGGINDQIGGGFSRYSVDTKWHIPHFEKMLYDNAQLISLYSKAYQLTKDTYFKTVVKETIEFIKTDLTHSNGAFYSALDADSKTKEGELEEGIFYSWTIEELQTLLKNDFRLFKDYYNINATGKWENNSYVLIKTQFDTIFAKSNNIALEDLKSKVSNWKTILYKYRETRQKPRKDDKVLTSWNALMLKAYVDAYRVFQNPKYLERAIKNGEFIKNNQIDSNGSLFHTYKDGKSSVIGFSEDYAHTISAFIDLYQATLNENWLTTAKQLMDYCIAHFEDNKSGMFFFTSDTESSLIARKIDVTDNVIPSSNSVLADNLFKLSHYYSETNYAKMAKQMLSNIKPDIEKAPAGYSNWLSLFLNYSNPYYEVAISGENALEKLNEIDKQYLPNILIAGSKAESNLPIMKNRYNQSETLIFVCVDGTCKLPVTETSKALDQLLK